MPNETVNLESAVETAALTILEFVTPPGPSIPLPKNDDPKVIELNRKFNEAVPLISEGFLAHWLPILNQVEEQLKELEEKQKFLIEELKNTNTRFENQDNYEYIALSQRAFQLKLFKEQQLVQVAQIKQRERTFDQTVLAARVVEHTPVEQQNVVTKAIKKKKKDKSKEKGK
ncbi:4686_t:CDS:2, partial [Acaulospora colombiana]